MNPLLEIYAEALKTRDDLTEPQRKIVLDVASKVTKKIPTCGWNCEGDFAITFNLRDVYLDILIDKRGWSEWLFESDLDVTTGGTKGHKQKAISPAFWERLAQVQESP